MTIDDMDASEESGQEREGPVDQVEPEMPVEKKKRKKSKGSKARKKKAQQTKLNNLPPKRIKPADAN